MVTKGWFTSTTDKWATPTDFFNLLDKEFHFDLDPCADETNHKCEKYFSVAEDGLKQNWNGYRVFCNPPYGKDSIHWIKKAYETNRDHGTLIVMLLPARTDTKWFHDYILGKAEIRFIRGRLKYNDGKQNAPFPSMVVIYREGS